MHASRYTLSFDNVNKCPVKSKCKARFFNLAFIPAYRFG